MEPECHLCILLWLEARTKLLHYRISMGEDEEEFKKHIQVYKKLDSQFAELHIMCGGIEMGNLAVYRDTQFEASMRSLVTASILKSPYPLAALSYETSSEAHNSLANAWISECHDNHVKCLLAEEIHAEGPTCLVSVGTSPNFDNVCLRAFEADNLRPKYVTLSYRWGGADVFKLTTEIQEIMKTRIPVHFLAKTIKQVIALTRRLGVEFIWIDSLCILQD